MTLTKLQKRDIEDGPFFSIIMAAYNVEDYLDDAINSIMNQSLNVKKYVEVIIVNDGSKDDTLKIARRWEEKYPAIIKVIDQENGGVSVARNNGLKAAKGQYINFMDADDKLDSTVLLAIRTFFCQYPSVKIAKIPLRMFEAKTGPHVLNKFFTKSEEIVHIDKTPQKIFAHIASTFIQRNVLIDNGLEFEVGRKYGEDLALAVKAVEIEQQFGLINDVYYNYRSRDAADSAMDSSRSDPETYIPNADMMLDIIDEYKDEDNVIDQWLQNVIMYDLAWKIKREEVPFETTPEWYDEYLEKAINILQYIDDSVIDEQSHLKWVEKEAIKFTKYSGIFPTYKENIGNTIIKANDVDLHNGNHRYKLSNLKMKTYTIKYRPETDMLNILSSFDNLWGDGNVSIVLTDGEQEFFADKITEQSEKKMIGIPIHKVELFNFSIPLADLSDTTQLHFHAKYVGTDIDVPIANDFGGMLVSIGTGIKNNYIWAKSKLIRFDFKTNDFMFFDNTVENLTELEAKMQKGILISNLSKERKKEIIYLRRLSFESKTNSRVINLFMDRFDKADDNAEVLYQMAEKQHPEWDNYFVLTRDSIDWDRLKSLDYKLVEYGSQEHERLLVQTTNLVSSQANLTELRPWPTDFGYLRDAYHYNFVFLQHGVTKHDLSNWLRKLEKDIRLLITVSDYEKQGFLDYNYGYEEEDVVVTGFPRFDRYQVEQQRDAKEQGTILIAPTWRNGIWNDKDTIDEKEEKLKATDFYKAWQELLDTPLLKELVDKGNQVVWLPHPNFRIVDEAFDVPDYIDVVSEDKRYVEILVEADMLVTDFSSIYFDIAYQNKPTLYYQFDAGNVNNKPGYFDFDTMGFGLVSEELEPLMNNLRETVDNGFMIDPLFKYRVSDFFKFVDADNSKRVVSEIEKKIQYKEKLTSLTNRELEMIFTNNNSTGALFAAKIGNQAKNFSMKSFAKKTLKKDSRSYRAAKAMYKKFH